MRYPMHSKGHLKHCQVRVPCNHVTARASAANTYIRETAARLVMPKARIKTASSAYAFLQRSQPSPRANVSQTKHTQGWMIGWKTFQSTPECSFDFPGILDNCTTIPIKTTMALCLR